MQVLEKFNVTHLFNIKPLFTFFSLFFLHVWDASSSHVSLAFMGWCERCSVNVRNALIATFPDWDAVFLPKTHLHEHIPEKHKRSPHHELAEYHQWQNTGLKTWDKVQLSKWLPIFCPLDFFFYRFIALPRVHTLLHELYFSCTLLSASLTHSCLLLKYNWRWISN